MKSVAERITEVHKSLAKTLSTAEDNGHLISSHKKILVYRMNDGSTLVVDLEADKVYT